MHTIEIPEANKTFYLPETLAECDTNQYIEMCHLLYRYQMQYISYFDLRVQAFYQLLNLKPSKKEHLLVDEETKWGNVYQLSELIDTFFEDKEGQKIIKIDYGHNPVGRFKPLRRFYYGPANHFTNIKFGEYLEGLRVFNQYHVTPADELLRQLAAIFYRKQKPLLWLQRKIKGFDGDVRRPYNPHTLQAREIAFKYAPWGFLYGFYLMFGAFQKFVSTAVLPWGGKEIDFSILFEDSGDYYAEAVPGRGLDGVAMVLAESGQLGNINQVREAPLWDVMMLLYDLKKQDLDRKLNEKQNTSK
jgi:hypothetical protein